MNDERPVARSSMVPALACILLMLFGLNFYRFLDIHFFSKWGWDFRCPTEEACCRGAFIHEHVRPNAPHVILFEFDQHQQELEKTERAMERARQDLERLNERMEFKVDIDVKRLERALRIKMERLEHLERELQIRAESPVEADVALRRRLGLDQEAAQIHIMR